jgi:tetratricopeptide (TPR) repeat protein
MKFEDDILIERFLDDQLSSEEKRSFLKRLDTDSDFKDYFELEKQLYDSFNDNHWSFIEDSSSDEILAYETLLKDPQTKKIQKAIEKANDLYQKNQKPSKNWLLYIAAAVVIALFSTVIFNNISPQEKDLYAVYLQKTELLSLVDRGAYDSIFSTTQSAFENQEYEEVMNSLLPIIDSINNGNAYIYLAIAQLELERFEEAEETLDEFISSDLLDSQKGYWFKSLLYLKANRLEKTKEELQGIIDSVFYKSEEAKQLLRDLN